MQPDARRDTLKRLLRETTVRRQADLVRLLRSEGFDCTQSSISRDLRELGVAKFGDHYVIANEGGAAVPANDAFAALAGWVPAANPTKAVKPLYLRKRISVLRLKVRTCCSLRPEWVAVPVPEPLR